MQYLVSTSYTQRWELGWRLKKKKYMMSPESVCINPSLNNLFGNLWLLDQMELVSGQALLSTWIIFRVTRLDQMDSGSNSFWRLLKYFNNNLVTDGFMYCESTECYSHTLTNTVDQTNGSEWVLVTIYRNCKKNMDNILKWIRRISNIILQKISGISVKGE